jgi:phosphatidylinositol dimannoside acyltransferase
VELSVGALRAASVLARHAPAPVARLATRGLSVASVRRSAEQRLIAERNLRRIYGLPLDGVIPDPAARTAPLPADAPITEADLDAKVQQVFDGYARYWYESLRLPSLDLDEVDRRFTYEGLEHIVEPSRRGSGVIMALPHLGGWEWAGRWLIEVLGLHLTAAVERLEPPELYEWFLQYRRDELGMQIIPVDQGAASALGAALLSGSVLALLCDRDLTGDGVEVELFGERTRMPGGPAVLALRSGCPLVPVGVFFDGDGHHAVVGPPLDTERRGRLREDVARVTQDLARALEELIARDPVQWHMLQPNWPSDHAALGGSTAAAPAGDEPTVA